MSPIKATALSTAAGGLLLGGLVMLYLPKTRREEQWTSAKGHSLACQDYADGKQRLFTLKDSHKVRLPGIIHQTMSYIRDARRDGRLVHFAYQPSMYQFAEAYNQTMARLLALESKSASAI